MSWGIPTRRPLLPRPPLRADLSSSWCRCPSSPPAAGWSRGTGSEPECFAAETRKSLPARQWKYGKALSKISLRTLWERRRTTDRYVAGRDGEARVCHVVHPVEQSLVVYLLLIVPARWKVTEALKSKNLIAHLTWRGSRRWCPGRCRSWGGRTFPGRRARRRACAAPSACPADPTRPCPCSGTSSATGRRRWTETGQLITHVQNALSMVCLWQAISKFLG